jgi:hypothetical protein
LRVRLEQSEAVSSPTDSHRGNQRFSGKTSGLSVAHGVSPSAMLLARSRKYA